MKKKSPARALLWLLLIPGQLLLDAGLITAGTMLDVSLQSGGSGDHMGHMVPFFSVIFILAAGLFTLIAVILAIVLTIVRYSKIKKTNRTEQA